MATQKDNASNDKLTLKLKVDALRSGQLDSELINALVQRAKAHFQMIEGESALTNSIATEVKVEFDKDPHDKDPHDKADPHDRDNFSRDNFSRFT